MSPDQCSLRWASALRDAAGTAVLFHTQCMHLPIPPPPSLCAQTVWVEWGNEPWHTGFESGKYAQIQGLALGLGEQGAAWYGGATNEARLCYVGYRTAAVSRVWRAVFGSRVKVRGCAASTRVLHSTHCPWERPPCCGCAPQCTVRVLVNRVECSCMRETQRALPL